MKFHSLKSIFFIAISALAISINVQAVEQVVATVDGTPILESQLKQALGGKANTESNRTKALDSIIDDMLVQKAIKESGVKVNQAHVDQIVRNIAAQNGLTYGQLLDVLDYQGISLQQFRNNIANQILMSEVRNRSIGKYIDISREQVEALSHQMWEQAKNSGNQQALTATHYKVRHILLKLNPLLNDDQAKAELSKVRADITSGKTTFAKAAKDYSKDYLSGANGGDLGFAPADNYVPEFAKQIVNAKKGTITAPFKTEFGWHILEVTDTKQGEASENTFHQKAYETLVNQQLQEESKDWVKALRKGADIRYLVK
ncbi:peptidylprolyl isomerase [Lonepinella koalarum]|uniref:Periplasmic chaperone for outer membrane proteins SurA n=1 Tax=Lonepinella koalarum TaxID=53417 RepID=A0A4R1KYL7_9PAST|nr:peptidylprolyl isomerase [Lonepinella koalarum]MDH2926394.1 peptidylprolyl isomerase [Lonepinella koalarum]TCK69670.1 periplasmic chaperone for outer membrane proteins SurA [Lonepinella koalarum]TFJ89912.1 peptidylprolyl isomerase [Lonepinella koalarum]TYG34235.1 peptidylprolyl isomerase [Lonepinella koalarum]